jgi:sarcosine oxidase subunit beta
MVELLKRPPRLGGYPGENIRLKRYSILELARNARGYHENWWEAWRSPAPKPSYDAIIVGGGGHGLATAYYLAKEHNVRNVAVLERGWLGGGNTGRNTTIVRSNYLQDESAALYEKSLQLFERLSADLNYNVMMSQRGLLAICHTPHELREAQRRCHAMRLNDIDSEMVDVPELQRLVPILDVAGSKRYPVLGGLLQRRGGVARHDAVAWGYARAADAFGVDIIQNCEVTGIRREGGRVVGVETTRGPIAAKKIGIVAAGHTTTLADIAGLRLPIHSHPLQALVSEPIKPLVPCVVMSAQVHVYLSQSDKGEIVMGAGIDMFQSYGQRGSLPVLEGQLAAACELFPVISRLRMLRTWAGIVDICPDASPIIAKMPVEGLYVNGGWGTGGFKATPGSGWVFAHTIARDAPHPLNARYTLERFSSGHLIDEHAAAGVAH